MLLDHSSGGSPELRSLENKVARMWCVDGSFFKKPYNNPSGPGAEVEDFLPRIDLISLGRMGHFQPIFSMVRVRVKLG